MLSLERFEYFAPRTVTEAITILSKYGKEANIIAGGTDLIPLLKRRAIPSPKYIVDLKGISELNYVKYDHTDGLRIGALTTMSDLEESEVIKEKFGLIYDAAHSIGGFQVRNMATIGGNLCRASPAADMPPPLLALNSDVRIIGFKGERVIPLEKFFIGPGQKDLRFDEILTEIHSPPMEFNMKTTFIKMGRVASDIAKISIAIAMHAEEKVCKDIRIALGSVAPTPVRAKKTEEFLIGKEINDDVIRKAADVLSEEVQPITDVRSTAEYRRQMSKILLRRALLKLLEGVG
jgi:carbon-monoxide dehydrogenase medium subunit